ncbi:MAG TPA: hypothetical protein DD641_05035 [Deltaproteobacteria bacterium]|nr:hypothetical protein [Deltaproteobacteria bacterium]
MVNNFLFWGSGLAISYLVCKELFEESNWKIKDCADKLKISRITLWRKMKELGIKRN